MKHNKLIVLVLVAMLCLVSLQTAFAAKVSTSSEATSTKLAVPKNVSAQTTTTAPGDETTATPVEPIYYTVTFYSFNTVKVLAGECVSRPSDPVPPAGSMSEFQGWFEQDAPSCV